MTTYNQCSAQWHSNTQLVLLRLSSLRFLSRYLRSIISYLSCARGRYICMALSQCKQDRFTTSLLKFQHALLRAAACREWRSACDCTTLGEQRLHERPPQLPLKSDRRWSGLRSRLYDVTINSVFVHCGLQFSVLCSVWMESISL